MNNKLTGPPSAGRPLRLWPGVAIAVIALILRFVVPRFVPDTVPIGVMGSVAGALLIALWWLFFSRAPWSERLGALGVIVAAMLVTSRIIHPSIAGGAMGMLFFVLAIPLMGLALVAWAVAARRLQGGPRWASMVVTMVAVCGLLALIRTGGLDTEFHNDFSWRWTQSPEERLLARGGDGPVALPESGATEAVGAEWPGFRGGGRDGRALGAARIATDWTASPPVEMWRRPIGPGWSSFAVHGDRFFTQEQRGDDEIVSCYRVSTGEPVWAHSDATRFYESNAGPGPRGTPTLHDGRLYTLGANGLLNALEAADGSVIWSRNAAADTGAKLPGWGFSGSPLVRDDLVIVATSGALSAHDIATGNPRWVVPSRGGGYSSPQSMTIDGVPQVVQVAGSGAAGFAPAEGTLLWQNEWQGVPIVQPAMTEEGDVLIATGGTSGLGIRRLKIARGAGGWGVEERWTSIGLKPYFNDYVVHEGHAYGFDGRILSCIELKDGERRWKGGRYGSGQLVLLPGQDLLLVLSEQGELALVSATPDGFRELGRAPGIRGKSWNHPVVVGDVLLVRNAEEMAAFRLAPAGS